MQILWFLIHGTDSYKSAGNRGASSFSLSHVPGRLEENEESVMECGTQFLRYYCSQHPGAACWSAEGLLLATRHQGFINQPPGFIPDGIFDIYTIFFIFHYSKEKQAGERIKDLLFPDHHLKRLSWLYGSGFVQ